MTANLTIYTLELKDVIAVPMKTLKFQPQTEEGDAKESKLPTPVALKGEAPNTVWVLQGDKLVQTAVELGMSNSIYQEITSGLKRGDKVAVQYNETMAETKEGSKEENPFMPKPPGSKRNSNKGGNK